MISPFVYKGRVCLGCPGWPPIFLLVLASSVLGSGFEGFTMSLEGGLDEFREFFFEAATLADCRGYRPGLILIGLAGLWLSSQSFFPGGAH